MEMLPVFEQLVVLVLIMAAGVVLAKLDILNELFLEGLNKFLIRFTLPCMLINSMQQAYSEELMQNTLILFGISVASFAALILVVEIWGKCSKMPKRRSGMYQYMIVNGNTGFFGVPCNAGAIWGVGTLLQQHVLHPQYLCHLYLWPHRHCPRFGRTYHTEKNLLYNPAR